MVPFLDNISNAEKKKKGGGAEAGAVGGVEGQASVKLAVRDGAVFFCYQILVHTAKLRRWTAEASGG